MVTGVGKGFAPSATAAAKALGTVVRQDRHPPGVEGTNYSLTEMGKFIREGRNDPRVRAFAGQTISRAEALGLAKHIDYTAWVENDKLPTGGYTVRARNKTKVLATATAASLAHAWQELSVRLRGAGGLNADYGKLKTATQQTQAILDEIRRTTHYLQDPCNTELMATPARTLCLDDHGLCLTSSDCDDRCIALASATLSIGIETRIVGQAYSGSQFASHVICAILDENGNWLKVDPSSEKYNVGQSYPATKEFWMDPISGTMSASPNGPATTIGKEPDHGDFIGVGAVPVEPEPTGVGSLPTGLAVFPMAHAFAPGIDSASDVPVGMEGGLPCCFPEMPVHQAKDYAFSQQEVRGVGKLPQRQTALQASQEPSPPATPTLPKRV